MNKLGLHIKNIFSKLIDRPTEDTIIGKEVCSAAVTHRVYQDVVFEDTRKDCIIKWQNYNNADRDYEGIAYSEWHTAVLKFGKLIAGDRYRDANEEELMRRALKYIGGNNNE